MYSAFGVDHGYEIAKKKKPDTPSAGRLATGMLLPGFHGAVAGKKGSKLKAAAVEYGPALAGGVAGRAIAGGQGALIGSMAGAAGGTQYAHQKKWLKAQ